MVAVLNGTLDLAANRVEGRRLWWAPAADRERLPRRFAVTDAGDYADNLPRHTWHGRYALVVRFRWWWRPCWCWEEPRT